MTFFEKTGKGNSREKFRQNIAFALFGRLDDNPMPTLHTGGHLRFVKISAAMEGIIGTKGNRPQFRSFLQNPFERLGTDQWQSQGYLNGGFPHDRLSVQNFKMNLISGYESNPGLVFLIGIIKEEELVSDLHPQNLQNMFGLVSPKGGIGAVKLFGWNKKSAHWWFVQLWIYPKNDTGPFLFKD